MKRLEEQHNKVTEKRERFKKIDDFVITNSKIDQNSEFFDCSITTKGNLEGVEVDVIVQDILWVECQGLKAAVKAAL